MLFDLLKACTGNPSPKLVARILEETRAKEETKNREVEMFSRLNFFGQSSSQIRARAGATILSLRQHQGQDGSSDGSEDYGRLLTLPEPTALGVDSSDEEEVGGRRRPSGFRRISQRKARSSVLRSLRSMNSDDDSDQDDDQDEPVKSRERSRSRWGDGGASPVILKPSEIIRNAKFKQFKPGDVANGDAPLSPLPLAVITENDGDENDEEGEEEGVQEALLMKGDTEEERRETIKKFVLARFSGRGPASPEDSERVDPPPQHNPCMTRAASAPLPPSNPLPSAPHPPSDPIRSTPPARRISSKRMSSMTVHPKLLETICHEWMASVPWHVSPDLAALYVVITDCRVCCV